MGLFAILSSRTETKAASTDEIDRAIFKEHISLSVRPIGNSINFANDLVENLPTSGLNVIVLQTAPIPFNAGLAVHSTDLSDNTVNLAGQPGRDVLPTFTAANFDVQVVPEPASLLLLATGLGAAGVRGAFDRIAVKSRARDVVGGDAQSFRGVM